MSELSEAIEWIQRDVPWLFADQRQKVERVLAAAQIMAEIEAGAKWWPDAPPSTYKCEHLSHRVGWIHAAKHIPTAILARLKELSTGTEEAGDGEEAK